MVRSLLRAVLKKSVQTNDLNIGGPRGPCSYRSYLHRYRIFDHAIGRSVQLLAGNNWVLLTGSPCISLQGKPVNKKHRPGRFASFFFSKSLNRSLWICPVEIAFTFLRPGARKTRPKSPRFEIGTMLGFVGTCSYGDRTSATTMIHGDKPCFMVVRCRSVAVGMLHGGRYQRRY